MRTRRLGRTERRWGPGTLWSAAALAVALILVLARVLVPDLFIRAVAPVFSVGNALSALAAGTLGGFSDARALAERNAQLAGENARLTLENRTLAGKAADLAALVGTESSGVPRGIVAGVLARPPTAPYDTLILAAGTDAGVRVLARAYGEGGVPLGIIVETSARVSRLRLFSAPGVVTDAWVGDSRTPVTLRGAGAGAFTASVSQGSGVVEVDVVYVAGPGAVAMGTVARITGTSSDPVAALAVAPVANPFSITWVTLEDTGFVGPAASP